MNGRNGFLVAARRLAFVATLVIGAARPAAAGPRPMDVLVFSKTAGYRHASIPVAVAALQGLGARHGFEVVATEDAALFDDDTLAGFDAVVFLSTTGDVLDDEQQAAFERYIQAGGGYVGVHAASDTEYDWPWYGDLVGAYFRSHPAIQPACVLVADTVHPSTAHLPRRWNRRDEWYDYHENPRGRVHVLATVDETTYEGGAMGHDHPIAWCHEFDGGRSWYTAGGHTEESFAEPAFLEHVRQGIRWAAGRVDGDAAATVEGHFVRVILDDRVDDPLELEVTADGRVVFIERGGAIKVWRPDTGATVVAGVIEVFTGLEDGLLGLALDPAFDENGWLYLYYAPVGGPPRNVLARFTMKGDVVDPASEVVMLEVATQRDECCHSGGSLAFDRLGNLYLSTGDNTSPFASSGFTPIDERDGRAPFDAQKSAASTNDLRGKILRITPQPDGSYTIPPGNLFRADDPAARPEVFVMGCRNPFRIALDPDSNYLYWGEVGPDASSGSPDRGPAGHDEFNRTDAAGNFGWPYLIGKNRPYRDYDFASGIPGELYDPKGPTNDSPNRNGYAVLPAAEPAWISYPYGPSEEHPALGSGGRCAMAGPVVPRGGVDGRSAHALPAYYDGSVFLYDWARDRLLDVKLDEDGALLVMNRFVPEIDVQRPIDLELGPDGCLYLIEWGSGFGGGNHDARVSRIEYDASGKRPPAAAGSNAPAEAGEMLETAGRGVGGD